MLSWPSSISTNRIFCDTVALAPRLTCKGPLFRGKHCGHAGCFPLRAIHSIRLGRSSTIPTVLLQRCHILRNSSEGFIDLMASLLRLFGESVQSLAQPLLVALHVLNSLQIAFSELLQSTQSDHLLLLRLLCICHQLAQGSHLGALLALAFGMSQCQLLSSQRLQGNSSLLRCNPKVLAPRKLPTSREHFSHLRGSAVSQLKKKLHKCVSNMLRLVPLSSMRFETVKMACCMKVVSCSMEASRLCCSRSIRS